jgi:hypothetical protein
MGVVVVESFSVDGVLSEQGGVALGPTAGLYGVPMLSSFTEFHGQGTNIIHPSIICILIIQHTTIPRLITHTRIYGHFNVFFTGFACKYEN